MALRESSVRLPRALRKAIGPSVRLQPPSSRRNASSSTPSGTDNALDELEPDSSLSGSTRAGYEKDISAFDPIKQSRARKSQLPPSRYQFRSPKYYRGPLHPHQPPPESDPHSRRFVPGPFSLTRAEQTYESTIAPDILTLCYVHNPPGFKPPERAERLRKWEGDSPYFANRPRRGPRGGDVLRLLRKPITFRNIPKIERITVHSFISDALHDGSGPLHVAGMAVQAITNMRVETFKSKTSVPGWGIQPGKAYVSVKADLRGEDMHHFFGKLVDIVFPRIKDWKGIKKTSGDGSGNISLGLDPEDVAHFPEIEVNYDMYPPQYLPGCDITIHTSANTDKDARLLLSAMGIPFAGKYLNY